MDAAALWQFLAWGYPLTVAMEMPVLLAGLASRHPWRRRLFAAFWLTACTYPMVVIVLPLLLRDRSRSTYLAVAETFAPAAECLLFYLAFPPAAGPQRESSTWIRDGATIVAANLVSFLPIELARNAGWIDW